MLEAFDVAEGNIYSARDVFKNFEDETTNEIIEQFRPNTTFVAIESVLSNIPFLPINPFGLLLGARALIAESGKRSQHGWFYALHDLENLAEG